MDQKLDEGPVYLMTKVLFEHKKGPLIICAGMSMTVPIFCEKNFTRALRSTANEEALRCSETQQGFPPVSIAASA